MAIDQHRIVHVLLPQVPDRVQRTTYYRHNPTRFKFGLVQFSLVGKELLAQSKKNGFKICFVHLTNLIRMAKEGMWEMMQRTKIIQRIKLRTIIECDQEYTQSQNL